MIENATSSIADLTAAAAAFVQIYQSPTATALCAWDARWQQFKNVVQELPVPVGFRSDVANAPLPLLPRGLINALCIARSITIDAALEREICALEQYLTDLKITPLDVMTLRESIDAVGYEFENKVAAIRTLTRLQDEQMFQRERPEEFVGRHAQHAFCYPGEHRSMVNAARTALCCTREYAVAWTKLEAEFDPGKHGRERRDAALRLRDLIGIDRKKATAMRFTRTGLAAVDLDIWAAPGKGNARPANKLKLSQTVECFDVMLNWLDDTSGQQHRRHDIAHLREWLRGDAPLFVSGVRKLLCDGAVLVLLFNKARLELNQPMAEALNVFLSVDHMPELIAA